MPLLSPALVGGLAALSVLIHLLQRAFSPLRKVPGPILSLFSSAPLRWQELCANRTRYVHDLHLRYGPVVRLAPNEVSFTSLEALKEIYFSGGSGFEKTEFYDMFRVYGRRTMFTTLEREGHARRKRIIADRYANSNIQKPVPLSGVEERSRRFLQRCEAAGGSSVDIFMTLHSYACDCVTHHLFHPSGTDCLRKQEDEDMMHQVASDDSLANRLIQHYYPMLHATLSRVLYLFAKPRQTPLADAYVMDTSSNADPASFTLLSRLREKSSDLEAIDMAAECLDHMAAGIDTTGDGLCFLMWELSQPRSAKYLAALQKELRENGQNITLEKLPYLDAVVNEGLRCFPPIPMSLPRYAPAVGAVIGGFFIPGRTIVSCQAYSVHRINDDVFPQPEVFNPERWLEEMGESERKKLQFAFANGGRGCVGKHLALAEMKILLRDVYSRYTTVPDPSMTEEDMIMSDQLISSRPKGQRCLVRFEPIADP